VSRPVRPSEELTPRHGSKNLAPPARIELATFGLGSRSVPESSREVNRLRGQILGFSRRGVNALEAIATGGPGMWRVVQELLVDLVRAGEGILPEEERGRAASD